MTTQKKLTVTSYQQDKQKPVPSLHLYGAWMSKQGFPIGTPVILTCEQERITLQTHKHYNLHQDLQAVIIKQLEKLGNALDNLKKQQPWK